jgi:hypothetical protein
MNRTARITIIALATCLVVVLAWPDDVPPPTDDAAYAHGSDPAGASGEGASGVRFVRFTEPSANAFVVDVPAGWQVQGGIARREHGEYPWFRTRSADGQIEIRSTDPRTVASYLEPSQLTQMMGLREGQQSNGSTVRAFVDPVTYAADYAEGMAREHSCTSIQVTRRVDARAVMAEMPPETAHRYEMELTRQRDLMARYMPNARMEVVPGGVEYRCTDTDREGKVVVLSIRMEMPDRFGGPPHRSWLATPIAFIAPTARSAEAEVMMDRVTASFAMTPEYQQRGERMLAETQRQINQDNQRTDAELARIQQNIASIERQGAADRARINAETNAYIGQLQSESWQNRMDSQDEGMRRWSNAMMGTTDVHDAQTGTTHYGVQSGYDSYWTDPASNTVVGTQGHDNPDPLRFNPTRNLDDW